MSLRIKYKTSHKGENSARANPAFMYFFKVNYRNTRKRCKYFQS